MTGTLMIQLFKEQFKNSFIEGARKHLRKSLDRGASKREREMKI